MIGRAYTVQIPRVSQYGNFKKVHRRWEGGTLYNYGLGAANYPVPAVVPRETFAFTDQYMTRQPTGNGRYRVDCYQGDGTLFTTYYSFDE